MSAKTKHYTVHFFRVENFATTEKKKVGELWRLFCDEKTRTDSGSAPTVATSPAGYSFEMRELQVHSAVVTGCLALLGSEAPHIRDINGKERRVDTQPGDQFLQKNYFLYFKDTRVLVWQFNIAANHVNNLGLLLTGLTGTKQAVVCNVLVDDGFAFDPSTAAIQYVDLRIQAPKSLAQKAQVAQLDSNKWNIDIFRAMSEAKSSSMVLELCNRKGSSGTLASWVGDMVRKLSASEQTRTLRVRTLEMEEPVDLLVKRIKRRIQVKMNGLYPDRDSVLQELQAAKDDCDDEISRSI